MKKEGNAYSPIGKKYASTIDLKEAVCSSISKFVSSFFVIPVE